MFSDESGLLVTFLLALGVVLILIFLLAWVLKKINSVSARIGKQGEAPRLTVKEAVAVDHKRRLVLVQRDHIEHLLLIGGENDLLVEHHILPQMPTQQPSPQQRPQQPQTPRQQPAPQQQRGPALTAHPQHPNQAAHPVRPAARTPEASNPAVQDTPSKQAKAAPAMATAALKLQKADETTKAEDAKAAPEQKEPLADILTPAAKPTNAAPEAAKQKAPASQAANGKTDKDSGPDSAKPVEEKTEQKHPEAPKKTDQKSNIETADSAQKSTSTTDDKQAKPEEKAPDPAAAGYTTYDDEINRLLNELSGDSKK